MRAALKDFTESTNAVRLVVNDLQTEHLGALIHASASAGSSATTPNPTSSAPSPSPVASPSPAPVPNAVTTNLSATPGPSPLALIGTRHSVICTSLTVVLSGYFEVFIHDCAEAFMNQLPSRGKAFTALPPNMQRCHLEEGSRVLADKARGKAPEFTATPSDICTRLADALRQTPSKPLWEAFAKTQSNPNSGVIKDFLKNLGVDNPTQKIEAKAGKPWTSLCRDVELFISTRNQCAHTGTSANSPQPSTIIANCDLLDQMAEAMVSVLEDHLTAL